MRHNYPSDITPEQFALILPLLEMARKKTKPRIVDLYHVFCAILYLNKSGCQWRMMPNDFPKWRTVYFYFQQWGQSENEEPSLFEQALKMLVTQTRIDQTSFVIVDAQSVKNTDCAKNKGYDAGKKVSDIKRHIVVDTQGLPHAIAITTANITDRSGALEAFKKHRSTLESVVIQESLLQMEPAKFWGRQYRLPKEANFINL